MPVRTVGEYLERWGYTAKVPRRQDRTPRRSAMAGGHLSGIERGPPGGAEIHWCDETGAAADQHRDGDAREGRPARSRCRSPIRMNLISTIATRDRHHDLQRDDDGRTVIRPGANAERDDRKIPDRGSAEGP